MSYIADHTQKNVVYNDNGEMLECYEYYDRECGEKCVAINDLRTSMYIHEITAPEARALAKCLNLLCDYIEREDQ